MVTTAELAELMLRCRADHSGRRSRPVRFLRRVRRLDSTRFAIRLTGREHRANGLHTVVVELVSRPDPERQIEALVRRIHEAEFDGDAPDAERLRAELRTLQNAEAERLGAEFQRLCPDLSEEPARRARLLLSRHDQDPA